jgi:spermidine/putrescine transport system permease protein
MKHWLKYSYLTAIYLFLYFPLAVLVLYSFNQAHFSMKWQGFTWQWYQQLMTNGQLLKVALHSLLLAVSTASAATILGALLAVSLYRYRFLCKKFLYLLTFFLLVSPEIVIAIALLLFFSSLKMPLGFGTLLLAHITFCMPFVTITIYSRLLSMDSNLLEAARDLGATEWISFRRILIPLMMPALLAGWLLSFTLSLDDVMISFFVGGPDFPLLPLEIYSWVRLGIKPELNALCSVLLGVTLILVLVSQYLLQKKD